MRISCGHIDGVSAENGPPGIGVKSEGALRSMADTLSPSALHITGSSSSSESVHVSAEIQREMLGGRGHKYKYMYKQK